MSSRSSYQTHKRGRFVAESIKYPDGFIGCAIWLPDPVHVDSAAPDSVYNGPLFDFEYADLDDLIELLTYLRDSAVPDGYIPEDEDDALGSAAAWR
jgi:hypothetical protein